MLVPAIIVAAVALVAMTVPLVALHRNRRVDELSAELACIDGVTGLANRRCLDRDLVTLTADRESAAAVMAVVIDRFDTHLDTNGPGFGDELLRAVGSSMSRSVRSKDVVYRSDGHEFCVVLRGSGAKEAMRVAERVRVSVSRLVLPVEGGATVSIGVALGNGGDVVKTLGRADAAMRDAQRGGCDRVTLAAR
ncbi:MAG: hypothetical protein JWM34_793 [Ilumatobacteraceae bacterium]|nr:hypothetical protein [Ilumatobacteraceae bacterium]